jgi:hypothetical protein
MATVTQPSPSTAPSSDNSTAQEPEALRPTPLPMPSSTPTLTLYRMSYDLYERIGELGLLGPKDKVVLLDGLLVNQMTKGPRHSSSLLRGLAILQASIPAGWHVRPEQPIALRGGPDGDSVPEPDLMVVFGPLERYDRRHPEGSEVGLVLEISATTDALRIDRAALPRYAHAGIPIAWIVNIPDRSIEVHTEPSGPIADPGYRRLETLRPGQTLAGEIGNATIGPAAIAPIPVESFFAPN